MNTAEASTARGAGSSAAAPRWDGERASQTETPAARPGRGLAALLPAPPRRPSSRPAWGKKLELGQKGSAEGDVPEPSQGPGWAAWRLPGPAAHVGPGSLNEGVLPGAEPHPLARSPSLSSAFFLLEVVHPPTPSLFSDFSRHPFSSISPSQSVAHCLSGCVPPPLSLWALSLIRRPIPFSIYSSPAV